MKFSMVFRTYREPSWGRRGRNHMVVRFTTSCSVSAYSH